MFQQDYSFSEFGFSTKLIQDLVNEKETVKPLVDQFFSIEGLKNKARSRKFHQANRQLLVDRLVDQNKIIPLSDSTTANIQSFIEPNAVAITTGHQLNLLTGPLYSIYKVAQIISLCTELNAMDDAFHYVPVFWMATEDHDFEEINHINLFNSKIAWEKAGQTDRIAGEIIPSDIDEFVNAIQSKFSDEQQRELVNEFLAFYIDSPNLAAATRGLMNHLFGKLGLVIIDGNDAALKTQFLPIAQKELQESFVQEEVNKTNSRLESLNYHTQVHVRNCNLFMIDDEKIRHRIVLNEGGDFTVGASTYQTAELLEFLENNPEKFSPNALLRPVYQECVLPNIAYIGGAGEIAYWLQLKGVFDAINLDFPMLRVRDSLVLLREKEIAELSELGVSVLALKGDSNVILRELVKSDLDFSIETAAEIELLKTIERQLIEKSKQVDKSLEGLIAAEFVKIIKSIERIEEKMMKAAKTKQEGKANKIAKFQKKIYPNGGFQERYENFLPYYLSDQEFVGKIISNLIAKDQPSIKIVQI